MEYEKYKLIGVSNADVNEDEISKKRMEFKGVNLSTSEGIGCTVTEFDKSKKDIGGIISIDMKSLPSGMRAKDSVNHEKREVYWDSSLGGSRPVIMDMGGAKNRHVLEYKIVDLATKPNE